MTTTSYGRDLEQVQRDISELEQAQATSPLDFLSTARLVSKLYAKAALTGSWSDLARAEVAVDAAIPGAEDPSDYYYLKANIHLKRHELSGVLACLEQSPALAESAPGKMLRADVDFQLGQYDAARRGYDRAAELDPTWDAWARRAHFEGQLGDEQAADELYARAEDELTAKEMRSFAWVELQRGVLHLVHGRHELAYHHYQRADRAYTGYWLVDEHRAELLAARGQLDEAVALYQTVVDTVPRPELLQAFSELLECAEQPERAAPWRDRALAAYLASARAGEVVYYHHLVDFYADVLEDGPAALVWAKKDFDLRPNHATRGALAWAHHRAGQTREAADMMAAALASGVKDAHLFRRAASVFSAASRPEEAARYASLAASLNPHHDVFHVHR
jgi:tetratricopeptide (TPR) repeat protein